MEILLNDIAIMKKQHACGFNEWRIIRVGADIGILCQNCQRKIFLSRAEFIKKNKKIKHTSESKNGSGQVIIDRLGEK